MLLKQGKMLSPHIQLDITIFNFTKDIIVEYLLSKTDPINATTSQPQIEVTTQKVSRLLR